MPEGLVALIPLIASIAGASASGIGLGESLANQPGTPKPVTPSPGVTDANAQQTAANQKALISQQLPGLQAQVGGSLSPDTLVQLATLISGQAGTPGISGANQGILNQIQAGSTNTTPQTSGLTNSSFG